MSNKDEALFLADVIENDPQSKAHHDAAAALLRRQHAEIESLKAEHEEDQGVIRVWRRRTEQAEAEREALRAALASNMPTVGMGWIDRAKKAEAEADALRADAERWRFVAAQMTHEQYGPHVGWTLGVLFAGDAPELAIDAAIDAAREGKRDE